MQCSVQLSSVFILFFCLFICFRIIFLSNVGRVLSGLCIFFFFFQFMMALKFAVTLDQLYCGSFFLLDKEALHYVVLLE